MINNTIIFASVAGFSLLVSFALDKQKTRDAIRKGASMFTGIAPSFMNVLVLVSVLLFFVPQEIIAEYMGDESGMLGFFIAAVFGSITLIPGFISYPIAASLIANGISYSVVAVFITTLVMVGVVTLPLEIKYFGRKAAILRNAMNFVAALIIGICVGWLMRIW